MANAHPNVVLCEQQPSVSTSEIPQTRDPYRLLHIMESFPMFSQDIIDVLPDDDTCETIKRKVRNLHHLIEGLLTHSQEIVDLFSEGEPYETIMRKADSLNQLIQNLPVLSQEVDDLFPVGEIYEALKRRTDLLHHNLGALSQQSKGLQRIRSSNQ